MVSSWVSVVLKRLSLKAGGRHLRGLLGVRRHQEPAPEPGPAHGLREGLRLHRAA